MFQYLNYRLKHTLNLRTITIIFIKSFNYYIKSNLSKKFLGEIFFQKVANKTKTVLLYIFWNNIILCTLKS